MKKLVIICGLIIIAGIVLFGMMNKKSLPDIVTTPTQDTAQNTNNVEPVACTADAKICSDGSAVGRTGPACTFAPCPAVDATSARTTTYLGGTTMALNVTISPQEIVSDSRCPIDTQCIWAGTVEVRTVISTTTAHGEHIMTLGEAQIFGDYTVTLVEVTPTASETAIPESSYRFVYEIVKN